jgi:hypothetical protein
MESAVPSRKDRIRTTSARLRIPAAARAHAMAREPATSLSRRAV